jgi:formate dehydrogenase accessory protein FdhD
MSAPLVAEAIVKLNLNGSRAFEWRCTPADLDALVLGRLYVSGAITDANSLRMSVDRIDEYEIRIDADADAVDPHSAREPTAPLPIPASETFARLFRDLFAAADMRHEAGGMHAAAATDGTQLVKQVEDVGRHNAVDKIIGLLLMAGLPFSAHGLLVSSRVSGEIAHKAVRAGFAWLASRSIPTTLAVHNAARGQLPIIGRAASKNAHVY